MSDLRLWSREMIIDLIDMYKSYPCLWKVKSEAYKNKHVKSVAYKEMSDFCKSRGFPEANRDFVVRKIQSLRGSFRKELRKRRECKRMGKNYQSNLWYFDNLLFTKDQESSGTGDENQSGEETCESSHDAYDDDRNGGDGNDDDDDDDENDDDDKFLADVKPSTAMVDVPIYIADSPQSPQHDEKKLKRTEDCIQPEFFDVGQDCSKFKELSEFELTGLNIAKKLAKMDPMQAIYAETIINNVVSKGLLKKLTEETDLCNNMCAKKNKF